VITPPSPSVGVVLEVMKIDQTMDSRFQYTHSRLLLQLGCTLYQLNACPLVRKDLHNYKATSCGFFLEPWPNQKCNLPSGVQLIIEKNHIRCHVMNSEVCYPRTHGECWTYRFIIDKYALSCGLTNDIIELNHKAWGSTGVEWPPRFPI
jgi:hypothetical protein